MFSFRAGSTAHCIYGFSLPQTLVKTLAKNLVKTLAKGSSDTLTDNCKNKQVIALPLINEVRPSQKKGE